ncbi:hypothetical protein [Manganibacter manganicus]|uniref:hypothetical protein n=1 Tax=Manganibacter manganicus TaxID=1873176 RepID=UPI0013020C3F|nr:hypothetical protein [Pseudaminobacter manganicus]
MAEHELDHDNSRGHAGWFMRGFATAVLLCAALLYFGGFFDPAGSQDLDHSRTIIVGK